MDIRKSCYIQETGERIGLSRELDYIICFGVLSYIPDPLPTFRAVYEALKPSGRFVICLMSYEGNRLYLCTFGFLRTITTRMPNRMLLALCKILNRCLSAYIALCKRIPLPLHTSVINVVSKFSRKKRLPIISDPLNPTFGKYYGKAKAEGLFANAGFENPRLRHRHGYSSTAVGQRPKDDD